MSNGESDCCNDTSIQLYFTKHVVAENNKINEHIILRKRNQNSRQSLSAVYRTT